MDCYTLNGWTEVADLSDEVVLSEFLTDAGYSEFYTVGDSDVFQLVVYSPIKENPDSYLIEVVTASAYYLLSAKGLPAVLEFLRLYAPICQIGQ